MCKVQVNKNKDDDEEEDEEARIVAEQNADLDMMIL